MPLVRLRACLTGCGALASELLSLRFWKLAVGDAGLMGEYMSALADGGPWGMSSNGVPSENVEPCRRSGGGRPRASVCL